MRLRNFLTLKKMTADSWSEDAILVDKDSSSEGLLSSEHDSRFTVLLTLFDDDGLDIFFTVESLMSIEDLIILYMLFSCWDAGIELRDLYR